MRKDNVVLLDDYRTALVIYGKESTHVALVCMVEDYIEGRNVEIDEDIMRAIVKDWLYIVQQ